MTNEPTSSTGQEPSSAILPAAFGSLSQAAPTPAAFATATISIGAWSPPTVGEDEVAAEQDPGPSEEEIAQLAREVLIAETTAATRAQMVAENEAAQETLAQELRAPMLSAAERLSQAQFELTQRVHLDTVDLAVHLAEKIVRRTIELDRNLVAENLEQALRAAGTLESVVIRMHPDDREIISQHAPALAEAVADRPVEIELRADEDLLPGDCVLRFEDGGVDARFSTQIASMANSVRELVLQRAPGEGKTS